MDGVCSVCPQLSHPREEEVTSGSGPLAARPPPSLIPSQTGSFSVSCGARRPICVGWRSAGSMLRMLQGGMRVHALQIQSNCTRPGLRTACWGFNTDAEPASTCPAWHSQNCEHTLCCATEPTLLATCALIPPAPAGQAAWPRNPACYVCPCECGSKCCACTSQLAGQASCNCWHLLVGAVGGDAPASGAASRTAEAP